MLAGRIVHNRHGYGPVPVVCCATSRRFGPVTSEQRRDLALMWHSKGVPMEDITRLLHISEQEARDIIAGTPQAGEGPGFAAITGAHK